MYWDFVHFIKPKYSANESEKKVSNQIAAETDKILLCKTKFSGKSFLVLDILMKTIINTIQPLNWKDTSVIFLLQCATCESHLSNSTPIVQKWAYTPEADKFVVSRRPEPEQQEFDKLRQEIINYLVGMHFFISYTR